MENKYALNPPVNIFSYCHTVPESLPLSIATINNNSSTILKVNLHDDLQKRYFEENPVKIYASLKSSIENYEETNDGVFYELSRLSGPLEEEKEFVRKYARIQQKKLQKPRDIPNRMKPLLEDVQYALDKQTIPQKPVLPAIFSSRKTNSNETLEISNKPKTPIFEPDKLMTFSPISIPNIPQQDVVFIDETVAEIEKLRKRRYGILPQNDVVERIAIDLASKYTESSIAEELKAPFSTCEDNIELPPPQSHPPALPQDLEIRQVKLSYGLIISVDPKQFLPENWLDDHGMLFALDCVLDSSKCFVLDPLSFSNIEILNRCTIDAGKQSYSFFVAPICQDEHWICLLYSVSTSTLFMFDSLNAGVAQNRKQAFVYFLEEVLKRRMEEAGTSLAKGNYKFSELPMSYQKNTADCGIYCILGAERMVEGLHLTISQAEADDLRKNLFDKLMN